MTEALPPALPVTTHRFASFDGVELAWHEAGPVDGRALVLLHGLFSCAHVNWIKYGTAAALAEAGFRIIMPDLRGHGDSAAPHDPAAYPDDVLALDGEALVAHLGLADYDLGGFSLGARTTARMLVRGRVAPRRAILAGAGLMGMIGAASRFDWYRQAIALSGSDLDRTSPYYAAVRFMKANAVDTVAVDLLLQSAVGADEAALARVETPVLVVAGAEDQDNGSAEELAAALPHAVHRVIRGTHMSSVTFPDLGREIVAFLAA